MMRVSGPHDVRILACTNRDQIAKMALAREAATPASTGWADETSPRGREITTFLKNSSSQLWRNVVETFIASSL
jgi:hypothetical protein